MTDPTMSTPRVKWVLEVHIAGCDGCDWCKHFRSVGLREKFERAYASDPISGCWLWTKYLARSGYAVMNGIGAHRVGYALYVGPVLAGLELDHLCRVHPCVNPAHLEPVTGRENIRRGVGPASHALRTNECMSGHAFTPENTYRRRNGMRACRECSRIATRRWLAERRDPSLPPPRPLRDRTHCPRGHAYDSANTYYRPDGSGRDCKTCRYAITARYNAAKSTARALARKASP